MTSQPQSTQQQQQKLPHNRSIYSTTGSSSSPKQQQQYKKLAERSPSSTPPPLPATGTSYQNMDEVEGRTRANDEISCTQHEFKDMCYELISYFRNRPVKKKILTVMMMFVAVFVVWDFGWGHNIVRILTVFGQDFLANHIGLGAVLSVLLLTICALTMIPPSLGLFLAGYVYTEALGNWGIALALAVGLVGCTSGAILAFFRARYMMRDLITLFAERYRVIRAADRAIQRHGFRVFLWLRLCPLIPFNALNYIGGITDVSFEQFLGSLLIGMIPMVLLTVLAGATAETLVLERNSAPNAENSDNSAEYHNMVLWRGVVMLVGFVLSLAAVLTTIFVARNELRKELALEEEKASSSRHQLQIDTDMPVPKLDSPTASSGSSNTSVRRDDVNQLTSLFVDEVFAWHAQDVEITPDGTKLYTDGTRVREPQNDEEWFWVFP